MPWKPAAMRSAEANSNVRDGRRTQPNLCPSRGVLGTRTFLRLMRATKKWPLCVSVSYGLRFSFQRDPVKQHAADAFAISGVVFGGVGIVAIQEHPRVLRIVQ